MIIKIEYDKAKRESEDLPVAQMIDCDELFLRETCDTWGFNAVKSGKVVASHDFPLKDNVVGYVMEGGKTVDRLPRK